MKNRSKGFTLAELLIVVAIIGVLVAVSIPIFSSQLKKARCATDQANVRSAKAAAMAEYMSNGESGSVSYLYDGTKAIELGSASISSFTLDNGYGKSDADDNKNNETGAAGNPKNGFVKVTIDSSSSNPIQATWVSSTGAATLATGNFSITGKITRAGLEKAVKDAGLNPSDITTFTAAPNSTLDEIDTGEKGKNGGIIYGNTMDNIFEGYDHLKKIDLSNAKLDHGNLNIFQNIPDSVQEIVLPSSSSKYDIRGIWYYADGSRTKAISGSGADPEKDTRILANSGGKTIYRTNPNQ